MRLVSSEIESVVHCGSSVSVGFSSFFANLTARKFGREAPVPTFARSKRRSAQKTSRKTPLHVLSWTSFNLSRCLKVLSAVGFWTTHPSVMTTNGQLYLESAAFEKEKWCPGLRTDPRFTKVEKTLLCVNLKRFC